MIHLSILHLNEFAKRCTVYGHEMSNVHQCHPCADFEWFPDFVISVSIISVSIYRHFNKILIISDFAADVLMYGFFFSIL